MYKIRKFNENSDKHEYFKRLSIGYFGEKTFSEETINLLSSDIYRLSKYGDIKLYDRTHKIGNHRICYFLRDYPYNYSIYKI